MHACFDLLHREIRSAKEGFDGRLVYTDTGFDSQGRVQRVSEPYFQGDVPYWNMTGYDQIGRVLEVVSAGGDDLLMAYGASGSAHCGVTSPHVAETTNGLGQKQLEVRNALGEATAVYDNNCGKVTYLYDAIGNLLEVTGVDGSRTRMSYDLAGRKITPVTLTKAIGSTNGTGWVNCSVNWTPRDRPWITSMTVWEGLHAAAN